MPVIAGPPPHFLLSSASSYVAGSNSGEPYSGALNRYLIRPMKQVGHALGQKARAVWTSYPKTTLVAGAVLMRLGYLYVDGATVMRGVTNARRAHLFFWLDWAGTLGNSDLTMPLGRTVHGIGLMSLISGTVIASYEAGRTLFSREPAENPQ